MRIPGMALAGFLWATLLITAAPAAAQVADAAMRRDVEAVRTLLRQGADVNAAQGDGVTALHWAAVHGDAEMARALLYAGGNPEAVTRHVSHAPLHIAAREGHAAVLEALLEGGANARAESSTAVTPLHLAAAGGSADAVRALLARGAEVDAQEQSWHQTPLIFASAYNHGEVMRVLLAAGADPGVYTRVHELAAQRNVDGAAQRVRSEVLNTFRTQAGDDLAWRPTPSQVQAAVRAAHQVQMTAQDADEVPDFGGGDEGVGGGGQTQGGLTPLLHAAREGHIEAALILLEAGADINEPKLVDGYTPLLMAVINGHYDLARVLLARGADPNIASTDDDISPLWATISNFWGAKTRYPQVQNQHYQEASYLEMLEALLQAGADPNHRIGSAPYYLQFTFGNLGVNFAGSTAFFRAAHAVDVAAMRLLVQYGADHTLTTLAPAGGGGRGGGAGGARGRGAGPDPDAGAAPAPPPGPRPGVHPVHAAAGVSYGRSYTANFHLHAPGGWMPALRYLVEELGHDVNVRDQDGYTPLHHAASRGDNEMILYLVEKGADVTVVANSGQTTVDMANGPGQRITPFPATIALLESMGAINNHRCVSCQ